MDKFLPITRKLHILLADDDLDDCQLFKEALEELPVPFRLTTVHNGEKLIDKLKKQTNKFPDVVFLDLNMPRKGGLATLLEIKQNSEWDHLPVIIFSNINDQDKIRKTFNDAAHYYIRKPAEFAQLKKVIYEALRMITKKNNSLPLKEKFELTGEL